MYGDYSQLIGLKVIGLTPFKPGDERVVFLCEGDKSFCIYSTGDCCSYSWFESLELPASFPFTIQKVDKVSLGEISTPKDEDSNGSYSDYLQQYSLKFETDKGHLDLEMRNSSNGYYGGSYELDVSDL